MMDHYLLNTKTELTGQEGFYNHEVIIYVIFNIQPKIIAYILP